MSIERFLNPRLTGARFDGHAIPLEFLKDLAVLEEMIIEVAKAEFLKDHPDRKRSPRGFTQGIELKLTGIEDGSAIPVISLVVATTATTLFPPDNQNYFERARDAVVSAIEAAEKNQSVTEYLPEKTLVYFDRIGRSLQAGEAIEFTTPTKTTPAKLTKETRRRLLLASESVNELTDEWTIRGTVPEADQDDMTFEVQLFDGRKVKAPITAPHLESILDAFNGYKTGTRVMLQGIGRFNRNNRLLGFESVEHISILDPLDISARLDELRSLKNGWLEGQGLAPPSQGIDWLSVVFDQHYPEDLPLPCLYPTEEGGIQAEWSIDPLDISLEVNLAEHSADWHQLNLETNQEESKTLNLNDAVDWQWLVEQIQNSDGGDA